MLSSEPVSVVVISHTQQQVVSSRSGGSMSDTGYGSTATVAAAQAVVTQSWLYCKLMQAEMTLATLR
jgi:hypothetical protein